MKRSAPIALNARIAVKSKSHKRQVEGTESS